jgi:hypothetical protein
MEQAIVRHLQRALAKPLAHTRHWRSQCHQIFGPTPAQLLPHKRSVSELGVLAAAVRQFDSILVVLGAVATDGSSERALTACCIDSTASRVMRSVISSNPATDPLPAG